jgi:nucleoside-diphosphate-sugar epimerase
VKACVTGATGFLGSHLVEALLERGDEVTCLVRSPAKAHRVFSRSQPKLVAGDLTNANALRAACRGADVVFHIAGTIAGRNRAEFAVNADGTRGVVEAAHAVAPNLWRFVYLSSLAAAGPSAKGRARVEDDPPAPISAYGESKLAGEQLAASSGLPWTIIRPPGVYGPRDIEFLRLFKFAAKGFGTVFGKGDQELSFIHVRDLVAAFLAVADHDVAGRTFFVSHPEVVNAREFTKAVHRAVHSSVPSEERHARRLRIVAIPPWVVRPALRSTALITRLFGKSTVLTADKANDFLAAAWTCSPDALQHETGWRAQIALQQGTQETAQWYRANGWL